MEINRCLLLAILMGSSLVASGQDSRMSDHSKEALKGAVEVSVSSDRQSYKHGEPILLTATIKNVGEAPFYVFPRTSFEDDGDGVFIVRVTETPKCKLGYTNMAGTPAPPAKDLKFVDYVQTTWKLLKPGESLQAHDVFHKINSPLCPGKYALTVSYLTELFWWSGERIHASDAELAFPAVFGLYRGNAITFQVQGTDEKTSDADSLVKSLQNYVGTPDEEPKTTEYVLAFVDLRDDGTREAIVYLSSNGWCGTAGCTMLILAPAGTSYKVVSRVPAVRLPIWVLVTKTNGWRDIGVVGRKSGNEPLYQAILSFDGKSYPYVSEGAELPLDGDTQGKIVIPASAKATPLYH